MTKGLFFLLLFLPITTFAQSTVTGNVTEAATGQPVPGANVLVEGTTNGTTSDFDGNFTIKNVNQGDNLIFSFLGFSTQTIEYTGQSTLTVALEEDAAQLDAVVVVGYGSVKKEDLTGAVNLVTTEDFNQGQVTSPEQLINGKIAGVTITSGGGAPGEGSSIRIRGTGSLSLSSNPLYVIDGVPINDGGVGGTRNVLNLINPNDIESFSVLKDASATAIYGSRAANGVVIITTKKGKSTDFRFNYSNRTSVYEPTAKVDVLDTNQFKEVVRNELAPEAALLLGNATTDWQDLIYQTAYGMEHNFSATGAVTENFPLRASVGYTDQDGILKSDNLKRLTGSLSLTPKFFDNTLSLEINGRYAHTDNTFANRGAISTANRYDPTQPVYSLNSPYTAYIDANGNAVGYFTFLNDAGTRQVANAPTNPIALLEQRSDVATVNRFIGNFKATYELPYVDGLSATVNVGYDKSKGEGATATTNKMPTAQIGFDGASSNYTNEATNKLFDAYINYATEIGKHGLDAQVGYSYQKFEFDNSSFSQTRILADDGSLDQDASAPETFLDESANTLLSYFGRLKYNFDDRYLVTATLRADASSKLNPDDRWGYFPSAALAWNIHKESFMEDGFFNLLKLRLGYGEIGNVNGLGDYRFLTRYVKSTNTAQYQLGSQFYQTYRPEPINENLRWEIGNTLNLGLDYGFWDNRISGSINAYIRKTKDLISNTIVDPFTNFGNKIESNIGDMENRGIEFELNATPIQTKDFEWNINYNVTFNENKITRLPDAQDVGGIAGGVGNTIQRHQVDMVPFSYFVFKQIYNENGKPVEGAYADLNDDGIINTQDRYFYKSPLPDITMGLSTNLSYKNLDLAVVSRASIGNYAYNNRASLSTVNSINLFPGYLTNIHADYLRTQFQNTTDSNLLSDYFIENASFIKIDNVTLGYTFQENFTKKPLRVYISGNNVLTVTKYRGLDPEINGGIDNNFYPRPRVYVLGVDVNF